MSDNKKIKMILNGALGRMGGYVLDAVLDTNDIEIIHGVDPQSLILQIIIKVLI